MNEKRAEVRVTAASIMNEKGSWKHVLWKAGGGGKEHCPEQKRH